MSLVVSSFAIWFIVITNKAMDLPIKHLIKTVIPALASSGVLWMAVYLYLRLAERMQFGDHWTLIIGVCIGVVTYILCMLILFKKTSKRFIERFRQIYASRGFSTRIDRKGLQKSKSFA